MRPSLVIGPGGVSSRLLDRLAHLPWLPLPDAVARCCVQPLRVEVANRSASLEARAGVARLVVCADLWFTTPAAVVQPLSGAWLAHQAGQPLTTPWLLASTALHLLAGACWLPVLWLQLHMAREVEAALAERRPLRAQHRRWQAAQERPGYPAFAAMLAVFFLMVNKPTLWA